MNNFCEPVENMSAGKEIKPTPLLKKRANIYANEVQETKVNPERCMSFNYGDRFIPRRYVLKNYELNLKNLTFLKNDDILVNRLLPGYWRIPNLKFNINSMFGIKTSRILEFTKSNDSNIMSSYGQSSNETIFGNKCGLDWPCKPRTKPLAFADTTHDLPGFDMFSDLNVIDWSVTGQMAASFGRDLVLWSPDRDVTMVYKIKNSQAITYCPKGKYLAFGRIKQNWPVFELWNLQEYRSLCICNGQKFKNKDDFVRCIEWEKSGNIVACGTETGKVFIFSVPDLELIRDLSNHQDPVFIIKFSPTSRYLATCDIEGNIIVYNWDKCDVHVTLQSRRKLRAVIDWHPWNGTDLAISEDMPASIVILNVPSKEIVAYYQRKDCLCQIDSISFNKISGELAVSCSIQDPDGCIKSEILVMSSLDRIVDVLRLPDIGVRFLMWSPDGMQLASAGNDETLTMWNFFSVSDRKALKAFSKHDKKDNKKSINFGNVFNSFNVLR